MEDQPQASSPNQRRRRWMTPGQVAEALAQASREAYPTPNGKAVRGMVDDVVLDEAVRLLRGEERTPLRQLHDVMVLLSPLVSYAEAMDQNGDNFELTARGVEILPRIMDELCELRENLESLDRRAERERAEPRGLAALATFNDASERAALLSQAEPGTADYFKAQAMRPLVRLWDALRPVFEAVPAWPHAAPVETYIERLAVNLHNLPAFIALGFPHKIDADTIAATVREIEADLHLAGARLRLVAERDAPEAVPLRLAWSEARVRVPAREEVVTLEQYGGRGLLTWELVDPVPLLDTIRDALVREAGEAALAAEATAGAR